MGLNLGKQIGPLPAGAWLGVVGGGLAIAYFINKNQAAKDATPAESQLGESGVGTGGSQLIYDPPTNVTPESPVEDATNQGWGVKALNYLISLNVDPSTADNAVRKYLSSMVLTPQEAALMNLVRLRFGAPPEPLAPVDDQPPILPPPSSPLGKPSAVTGLHVNRATKKNTIVWGYSGPAVAGFSLRVFDMHTGKTGTFWLPPTARSWVHTAPASWTWTTRHRENYFVRAYQGTQAAPVWGPDRSVMSVHLV